MFGLCDPAGETALVLVVDPGRGVQQLLQPVGAEQRRRPPELVDVDDLAGDVDVVLAGHLLADQLHREQRRQVVGADRLEGARVQRRRRGRGQVGDDVVPLVRDLRLVKDELGPLGHGLLRSSIFASRRRSRWQRAVRRRCRECSSAPYAAGFKCHQPSPPRLARTGMVGFMSTVPEVSPAVRAALAAGRPVVALESTIISHGLPRPANLAAARSFEEMLTETGVTPATIAVIDGVPKVGLDDRRPGADRPGRVGHQGERPRPRARDGDAKRTAGTTVAATSVLAARAGIRVFATGGLGGVHRGFAESLDESADLTVLSGDADHGRVGRREVDPRHPGDPGAAGNPRRRGRRLPHQPLPRVLPDRLGPGPGLAARLRRRRSPR